jgi:hypothetical protein
VTFPRSGAGSMPCALKISQTVQAATFTPTAASSPAHPPIAPGGVLSRQAQYQGPDGAHRAWPAPAARHATGSVAPSQQTAMPAQDRVRTHQQLQAPQRVPWRTVKKTSEKEPVLHREHGLDTPTLQDREPMPQGHYLGLQATIGHRQQAKQGERIRDSEAGQTQQHDTSWCRPALPT